jgi:hypothetical protein
VRLSAAPDHDDLGALLNELSCGCETDDARATGYDDNLVREAAHSRLPPEYDVKM